jgi:hypothetical protein
MAFSFASAPPFVKNTLLKPSGARPVINRAASARVALAWAGATVVSRCASSTVAATTFGC